MQDGWRQSLCCHKSKTTYALSWWTMQVKTPTPDIAGRLAPFTSNGPPADLSFKPDVSAPGNFVVVRVPGLITHHISLSTFKCTSSWQAVPAQAGSLCAPEVSAGTLVSLLGTNACHCTAQASLLLHSCRGNIDDAFLLLMSVRCSQTPLQAAGNLQAIPHVR